MRHIRHSSCPPLIATVAVLLLFTGCASNLHVDAARPELAPFLSEKAVEPVADDDILALNQEVIDFLERHITDTSNQQHRIKQLLHVIFHPGLVNLEYDNQRTKTALETYTSGKGNCLSFANLFVAAARHFRVDARFQEVVTTPTWSREGEVLWVSRHINVSGRLPFGVDYTIDFLPYLPYQRTKVEKTRVVSDEHAYAQYYNNLGAEFLTAGEPEKAFQYFRKSINFDSSLSFVWSNIATLYSRNEQFDMAERAFQYALKLNPREYTAMNNLAKMYSSLGRDEDASFYTERVKYFRNRNPYYHYWLGESAYKKGNYRDARRYFETAVGRKSQEHEFYFALAKTYLHLGLKQKAQRTFEQARKYVPDNKSHQYNQSLEQLASTEEALPEWGMTISD